jgi:hypothetical protein
MRAAGLALMGCVFLAAVASAQPRHAPYANPQCSDDYVTVERVAGDIIEIKPAPDPFRSADIFMSGPPPCLTMWMQVLKVDAAKCQVGDRVEARGVITSDPDSDSWQINPENNEYMLLNEDFTCTRQSPR